MESDERATTIDCERLGIREAKSTGTAGIPSPRQR
jgi:hypothetical protein